jgi:hypothetical protein
MKRLLAVLPILAASPHGALFAQCAMCYQNAAASGAKGIHALNLGILALVIPLVSVIGGITVATYRSRR